MKRDIEQFLKEDLKEKMVLLSGPRQVGKTTLSKQLHSSFEYLNFDSTKDRLIITKEEWNRNKEIVIFDEIHKMPNWKSWIKGVYDTEEKPPYYLLTGSARLDTYRKGGDSLAGRHFMYRLHPFTVKELSNHIDSKTSLDSIIKFGGFPEPFLKGSEAYAKRWRRTHIDTVIREDLLDLEKVRDIKSIGILVDLLRTRVGSLVSYSSLAEDLQVSIHTVKHWLQILENLYIIFAVRPYHKNISRSILKESKYYFYDTGAVVGDLGAKLENTIACALCAELHFHEDTTGDYVSLNFIRNKEKKEVDFITLVNDTPIHLIEVKTSDNSFSKNLCYFASFFKQYPKINCVQVVYNLDRERTHKENIHMLHAHSFLKDISF